MTLEELNAAAGDGSIDEMIRVAEARQRKALSRIADEICSRGQVRLVLVSGASSAGKTTTATRLCTQLRVNYASAFHLSTDDYFVGDKRNPRDENGELDYEHVECVDIPRLASDVNALFRGESIPRRRFDFVKHAPFYTDEFISLPAGGMVVLEGIHALNPRLTEGIDDAMKFRVFIEPKADLDVFGGGVGPTPSEARLLRRLMRDNQFRKRKPVDTFRLWPSVIAGEKKWIEPFRGNADATFNSYLVYELAALKFYAGGLIARARRELGDVPQIRALIRLLLTVNPISPEAIPGDSILRETIGGSQLEY
jgi:uridine kinase